MSSGHVADRETDSGQEEENGSIDRSSTNASDDDDDSLSNHDVLLPSNGENPGVSTQSSSNQRAWGSAAPAHPIETSSNTNNSNSNSNSDEIQQLLQFVNQGGYTMNGQPIFSTASGGHIAANSYAQAPAMGDIASPGRASPSQATTTSAAIQQLLQVVNPSGSSLPSSSNLPYQPPNFNFSMPAAAQPPAAPMLPSAESLNPAITQALVLSLLLSPQNNAILVQMLMQLLQQQNEPAPSPVTNNLSTMHLLSTLMQPQTAASQQLDTNNMLTSLLSNSAAAPSQLPAVTTTAGLQPGVSGTLGGLPLGMPFMQPMPPMAFTSMNAAAQYPLASTAGAAAVASSASYPPAAVPSAPVSSARPAPTKRRRRYRMETFPHKLHRLITEAKAANKEYIVRFSEDGLQFEILNTAEFEKLLPKYFRHGHISSFKRLLHMYNFKRVRGTWEEGTICHPKFRRDEPELCQEIVRVDRGYGSLY